MTERYTALLRYEGHNEKLLIAASLAKKGYFQFIQLLLLTLKRLFVLGFFVCFFFFFFFKMRNRSIQADDIISEVL